ncbi:acyl-CoA-binding domain-containing protein 6-like [Amphiura filiformis]|uniref:acyl-CoA-binding domain-containing protein 6-like n=1 Tax=Amphiura filiformis TaxID=82378 RepID=UPI003B20F50A
MANRMEPLSPGLEEEFILASEHMKTLAAKLDKDKLLYLYARYKQATVGKCSTLRPGIFDYQGRQKWDAWHEVRDLTTDDAMSEYVSAIHEIDPEWTSQNTTSGMGFGVSTMCREEEDHISDDDKTLFDWCKEGNAEQLSRLLANVDVDINKQDEEGLCLLHWACDRGHLDVLQLLLDNEAKVNATDAEGQTALHYAATCERLAIVELLLQHGANPTLADDDNTLPADNTDNPDIQQLLTG